ncbi:putative Leucine-rich receptor-like kinase family protein [Quillaja saponaria]|uniref:Leucine-rich receptor-like kinase family protein n=1 Tax=Quillaja saponaria TaxID=32244 RepID=A0AAD7L0Z6_QUISA|nr:putative Leucine-rich receptor-like kinase family protein [Quillaja saponaria]
MQGLWLAWTHLGPVELKSFLRGVGAVVGILRDAYMGKLLSALSSFYRSCTNMEAEVRALLDGLSFIKERGMMALWIESDFQTLVLEVPKSSVLIERNKHFSKSNKDLPLPIHETTIPSRETSRSNILSSWESEVDCCRWEGISCNNRTGSVITLNLKFYYRLGGEIDPSILCELQYLEYLDLSGNNLGGQRIPKCIGSLKHLINLSLAYTGFVGSIPCEQQNLSSLQTLDLYGNYNLMAKDLQWLSHLSSLRYLNLTYVDLSQAVDWLQSLNKIVPSLVDLNLQYCSLPKINILPRINSSTTLKVLDLSENNLASSTLTWVFNVSQNLIDLSLSNTWLQGHIPKGFQNMCRLKEIYLNFNKLSGDLSESLQQLSCSENTITTLDLGSNSFIGPLPDLQRFSSLELLNLQNKNLKGFFPKYFGNLPHLSSLDLSSNELSGSLSDFIVLPSLRYLDVSNNQLNGTIPSTIGQLSSLELLDLSSNSFNSVITEAHLFNLSGLQYFDVSHSLLSFNISSEWIPTFQSHKLDMSSCILGPNFPHWIKNQRALARLDISNCGISESIPEWLWDLSLRLSYLNISHNKIHGELPNLSPRNEKGDFQEFDLSSNYLSGPLPQFPPNTSLLNLSKNKFSGSLYSLCTTLVLKLSFLDLSNNLLSGTLPDCWKGFKELRIMILANNNFSGQIPTSIGSLHLIKTLHLSENNFSGEILTLNDCRELELIDLGDNKLDGEIPAWIGQNLPNLIVLRLRSNKLHGKIPISLRNLSALQILDISLNNISGKIPDCLNNLTALGDMNISRGTIDPKFMFAYSSSWNFIENAMVMMKGEEMEYEKSLGLMKSTDLSCNNFTGRIPLSLTSLVGLISLNLSRNNLMGFITDGIGQLQMLESLDLSKNVLFGGIPGTFSSLNFLSYLNISFNNLSGKIPLSTQLQSMDASAFIGNNGLFGPPLTKEYCIGDGNNSLNPSITSNSHINDKEGEESGLMSFGFYVSLAVGFVFGFWGVCGSLMLVSSWRYAYFQLFDKIKDWIYVKVVVFVASFQRISQS